MPRLITHRHATDTGRSGKNLAAADIPKSVLTCQKHAPTCQQHAPTCLETRMLRPQVKNMRRHAKSTRRHTKRRADMSKPRRECLGMFVFHVGARFCHVRDRSRSDREKSSGILSSLREMSCGCVRGPPMHCFETGLGPGVRQLQVTVPQGLATVIVCPWTLAKTSYQV